MTLLDSAGVFLAAVGAFGVIASAEANDSDYLGFQWASMFTFAFGLALMVY